MNRPEPLHGRHSVAEHGSEAPFLFFGGKIENIHLAGCRESFFAFSLRFILHLSFGGVSYSSREKKTFTF